MNPRPGHELPILLLLNFRSLIDSLHEQLAGVGHAAARPMHGFALQAIGAGCTATELADALGVSKQAAAKLVHRLETIGYVQRLADAADSRRKTITITGHGRDLLDRSARIFDDLRERWVRELGAEAVSGLEDGLAHMAGSARIAGLPGWLVMAEQ